MDPPSYSAATAPAFKNHHDAGEGGGGGGGNVRVGGVVSSGVLPVFNETQLDLVADRISKYDWPVVANHLQVPAEMLGDVGIITILR